MSLANAMSAFIQHDGDRSVMLIPLWATTYHVSEEAVRLEYERQMTIRSQVPSNSYETEGK